MTAHDDSQRDGSSPWTDEDVARLTALARSLLRDTSIGADDVVAEALAIAFASRDRRTPGPAGPWLRGIVRNVIRNAMRGERRRRDRERNSAPRETNDADDGDPSRIAEANETAARIRRALAHLDPPQKRILHTRYFLDRAPHAIARDLGLPAATLRSRLSRSLEDLRRALSFGSRDSRDSRREGTKARGLLFFLPRIAAATLLTLGTLRLVPPGGESPGHSANGASPRRELAAERTPEAPHAPDLATTGSGMKRRSPFGPPPSPSSEEELRRLPRKHAAAEAAQPGELAKAEGSPGKGEK